MLENIRRFASDKNNLPQISLLAAWFTILAGIVAIVALLLGFVQFRQSNEFQNKAAATGVLQSYLATAAEAPDDLQDQPYISVDGREVVNDKYGWLAANGIFTAETIYDASGEDEGWRRTAATIIRDYRAFVTDKRWRDASEGDDPWFQCEYYSQDFIAFMEEQVEEKVCPLRLGF